MLTEIKVCYSRKSNTYSHHHSHMTTHKWKSWLQILLHGARKIRVIPFAVMLSHNDSPALKKHVNFFPWWKQSTHKHVYCQWCNRSCSQNLFTVYIPVSWDFLIAFSYRTVFGMAKYLFINHIKATFLVYFSYCEYCKKHINQQHLTFWCSV